MSADSQNEKRLSLFLFALGCSAFFFGQQRIHLVDFPGNLSAFVFPANIVVVFLELFIFGGKLFKVPAQFFFSIFRRIEQTLLPLVTGLSGDTSLVTQRLDIRIRRKPFFL